MAFIIFIIAWLSLLVIHLTTAGEPEENSPAQYLARPAIVVVFVCAIYAMFTVGFMAAIGMIGSLALFQVHKEAE